MSPSYYLGYHTLLCILTKICSKNPTFDCFMKKDMKIHIFLAYDQTGTTTKTKTTLSGRSQGVNLIWKKHDHPNICFHRNDMFYFRNLRWTLTSKIQDGRHLGFFENWIYLCNGSRYLVGLFLKRYLHFKFQLVMWLSSWLSDCHLGTCPPVEEKIYILVY